MRDTISKTRERRTPPGVRELKLGGEAQRHEAQIRRTPPGVRELKPDPHG